MRRRWVQRALSAAAVLLALPASAAGPPAVRTTLPSGARLIVSEQHAVPLVVVNVLLDAGARRDPHVKEGLANLTAEVLTQGTKTRTATQINEAADFIGASFDASAEADYASLNLTVLRKELDAGLDLLTDVLLNASFPEAEVTRRREAALAAIQASEDDPGHVAQRAFAKALFGGQPYGHLTEGDPAAVKALTRADLLSFYGATYRPERAIITVVGDITADEVRARFESALREWKPGGAPAFEYPNTPAPPAETLTVNKPITQANIILGDHGVARDNPDYYALTVMNYVLGGGGFSSRLLDNIRTKAGLAYSVASFFTVNKSPGSFQVVMQTKNQSALEAIQRACGEIERMRTGGITDDELTDAKLYLTGSFPLRLDSSAKIAGFLAQVDFFNLGDDYADTYAQRINAVSRDDVRRVAQQYLHPEAMTLVVVTDTSQVVMPPGRPCAAPAPTPAS